jgi:hypothetical protein
MTRDESIRHSYANGCSMILLGNAYGISRQRVHQIVTERPGEECSSGGCHSVPAQGRTRCDGHLAQDNAKHRRARQRKGEG